VGPDQAITVGPVQTVIPTESSTYNARNDPTTHARALTTAYDCDGQGNLVKRTQPGAVVTSFGRDPAGTGLLKSVTDPRGKTERYDHDGQGNLSSVTSPKGFKATLSYDGSGRMTGAVDPRGNESGQDPADTAATAPARRPPDGRCSRRPHEARLENSRDYAGRRERETAIMAVLMNSGADKTGYKRPGQRGRRPGVSQTQTCLRATKYGFARGYAQPRRLSRR
jgi:YD repeat-containing protein